MKITNILTFCFSILLVVSCNEADEFLEVENPNGLRIDFQDLSDTNLALNGVYNTLFNDNLFNPILFGLLSDEASVGAARVEGGGANPSVALSQIDQYTFGNNSGLISANWAALYRGIFQANFVIMGLEGIQESISEDNQEEFDAQMAQARFFRGLFYFFLHSVYNEGNIVLRPEFNFSAINTGSPIASSQEVIDFYVADLEFAMEFLPNTWPQSQLGRVTSAAATMVLGNHFLYQRDFSRAKELYETVISSNNLSLANPEVLFTEAGEFSSESIFEINFDNQFLTELSTFNPVTPVNSLSFETSSVGSFNPGLLPASWLVVKYQEEALDPLRTESVESLNRLINPFSTALDIIPGSNPPETNDTIPQLRTISRRASAMMATIQDEHTPFYLAENAIDRGGQARLTVGNQSEFGAIFKKYNNHDTQPSENQLQEGNQANRRSGRNIVIHRLSEAYINLAECNIRLGEIDEALENLNAIRSRWGLVLLGPSNGDTERTYDEFPYDANTLMEHLMFTEKPLELAVEGMATRFIDLRRWAEDGFTGAGAQRFEDLAAQQFVFRNYSPRFLNGNVARAVIVRFPFEDNNSLDPFSEADIVTTFQGRSLIHSQFQGVSANYANFNGYLPIPFDEIQFNSDIE